MSQPAPVMQQPAPVMQAPVALAPMAAEPRMTPEPVRMPKVEDFPPVLRAEIDHRAQPAAPAAQDERGPMGLLKRITNSLGRQAEEEQVMGDMTGSAPAAPSQQRRPLSVEASLYAPRRGQLDDHGRATPARAASEDDQLEIPACAARRADFLPRIMDETRVERSGFLAFQGLFQEVEFLNLINGLASLQSERISDLAGRAVPRMYVIETGLSCPMTQVCDGLLQIHRLVASF
jgi:cell division protein FtsZ